MVQNALSKHYFFLYVVKRNIMLRFHALITILYYLVALQHYIGLYAVRNSGK